MKLIFRKPSFKKTVGAYKSWWTRFFRGFYISGYGVRGFGWLRDPARAVYNWCYNRTTFGLNDIFGKGSIFKSKKRGKGSGKIGFGKFFSDMRFIAGFLLAPIFVPLFAISDGLKYLKKYSKEQRAPSFSIGNGASKKKELSKDKIIGKSTDKMQSVSISADKNSDKIADKIEIERKSLITVADMKDLMPKSDEKLEMPSCDVPKNAEADENTPKSVPKNEKDQYIRKRMSFFAIGMRDPVLSIGTYFDISLDLSNAKEKDAVLLSIGGEKLSYMPLADKKTFAASLKLKRKIYGVITDIKETEGKMQYEYETWVCV